MKIIARHFEPPDLHMGVVALQETEAKIFLVATKFRFLKKKKL
jgi:hypothetical protein